MARLRCVCLAEVEDEVLVEVGLLGAPRGPGVQAGILHAAIKYWPSCQGCGTEVILTEVNIN